jgi:hypothetical protein
MSTSTHELKPGDRVRLTVQNRMRGYQPGDKGVVVRELVFDISGTHYFLVEMDQKGSRLEVRLEVYFRPDEIELDG